MTRLTLLANSRKPGGRCFAGVTDDGMWVRPVSSRNGGAIPDGASISNRQPFRPLDQIVFDSIEAVPLSYQCENLLVDPATIGTVNSSNDLDLIAVSAQALPYFLTQAGDSVMCDQVPNEESQCRSLALVEPDGLRIRRMGPTDWRATFFLNDVGFHLKISDDLFTSEIEVEDFTSDAFYLCISLADPFSPYGNAARHYKVVAGIVPK